MNVQVSTEQFDQLLTTWSNLIPWTGTPETLSAVYFGGYKIGTLSNGDYNTLKTSMEIFQPLGVNFTYFFNSDFPNVGTFKPDAHMYYQLTTLTSYTPYEILHVAGSPMDAWGARSAGFFSALVGSSPYSQPTPCFILDDITQLTKVLRL